TVETNGNWQYSIDAGANWVDVPAVSSTSALRLFDTNLVRFQPSANFNGTVNPGITFRAWDRSDAGAAGSTGDPSTNGGTTSYSTATETAAITVNTVNDAPVLDNSGDMAFTDIDED